MSSSKLKDVSPSSKDVSDSGAESEESVVLGFSVKPEVRDASNEISPQNDSKAIQTEELKPKVKSRKTKAIKDPETQKSKTKATKDSGTQKSKTKSKKCCGLFFF